MPLARSRQRPWGRDPGPMATAESSSHDVYIGPDVVVKIIDAYGHSRRDREIALAPHLPAGLTAPLLGSGLCRLGTRGSLRLLRPRARDGSRHGHAPAWTA
jgi:hypothetical protein